MYDPHYCYYTLYGRIKGQGGISNVYDPHYCYYTLYDCRDVLRVREVLVLCMTLTTVTIHCMDVLRVREVLVMCMTLTTIIIHCIGVGLY